MAFKTTQFANISLTWRLIFTASIVSFFSLLAVGIVLSAIFYSSMEKTFDLQLRINIDALAATITDDGKKLEVASQPTDPRFARPLSGYYWQVARLEKSNDNAEFNRISVFVKSASLFDEKLAPPEILISDAAQKIGETKYLNISRADENLRMAARIINLPNSKSQILLLATGDINELTTSVNYFNQILIISLAALAAGLMAANFLQVKLGLLPLTKMGRELAQIRAGDATHLDENIASELSPIAKELNALLNHNEEVVERARTHVGNLAHALKTPISVMLNEAKEYQTNFGQLVQNQTLTMTRQVEHYLKRAQAAARAETSRNRIQIQSVIDDLVRTLGRLYRHEGVRLDIIGQTDKFFRGDREDFEDLFGNLCENACKYGGGLVEISFEEKENGLNIIIDDDGEGLSEEEIKAALRRGVRLDETSHGSGLGLSIADETARAYGGSLKLQKSPLGGLRVNLYLPVMNTQI
jgi:signal transduction histidine kinase